MTRRLLLVLACSATLGVAPVLAAGAQAPSPEFQKLDVSIGHWMFQGTQAATASRPAQAFTWDEQCDWSSNHLFLECTFSNDWGGRRGKVESIVVDTYNTTDKSYWHYELYSIGQTGKNPFACKMDINGNVWTEYAREAIPGKQNGEQIIYTWESPSRVTVEIKTSKDGKTWTTVDKAEGVKR